MLQLAFLLPFSGQCWDQGWCKGNSLLERRKGRNGLFSPA